MKPHALGQVVSWLNADPSLDMLYSDEDKLNPAGRLTEARWKPDWSPNLLLCQNYVCHLLVLRRSLVESLGGLRRDFDGSQDYDLVLRVADVTDRIAHIPDSLYSWRMHPKSAAAAGEHKPWAWMAAQRALGDWLHRREDRGGTGGWTEEGAWEDVHRVQVQALRRAQGEHHHPDPQWPPPARALHREPRLADGLQQFRARGGRQPERRPRRPSSSSPPCPGKVLRYPHEFNYPRQLNLAAAAVECDLLVFLNNDTEVVTADWLDRLIEQAMRPEVGAVGPRLRLPERRHPARGHRDRRLAGPRQLDRVGPVVAHGRPAPRRDGSDRSVHGHPPRGLLASGRL